jgi:RNA polymerase sigma factor (sigma-70 family)
MSPSLQFFDRESKILHLIRNGDEKGLVMVFEDTRSMAVSYVKRNSGNEADAEEVLQEAVVILWEKVRGGSFEAQSKLSTFLMGVIKNLWARRLARRKRETPLPDEFDPPATEESPLDGLIREEQIEMMREAMSRITELCRNILLMFYWEEKSMEEIASNLGLANAETAKSKKYQCRKSLETHLRTLMNYE